MIAPMPCSLLTSPNCCATFEEKKEIFGPFRLLVGGNINNSDNEYDEETAAQLPPTVTAYDEQSAGRKRRTRRTTRSDGALEPVFYQSFKTVALWMEFLRGMCLKRIVAFCGGDFTLLEACMLLNVPVLGFSLKG